MTNLKKEPILKNKIGLLKDIQLSVFVFIIAGCGLIYQYLLASYSGRIIGVMEQAIFTIMTIIILSMGLGSFFAKYFKDKFFSFSILESVIGIVAVSTFFVISGSNAIANDLTHILSTHFNLPKEFFPEHGVVSLIRSFLNSTCYIMAAVLGFLIGLEIPFLASIRETLHKNRNLDNNIGVIYGVDYIGGGIGAFIYIFVLMKFDIQESIQIVAYTNVLVGFLFILFFKKNIKKFKTAMTFQFLTAIFIYFACSNLGTWRDKLEQSLYADKLIYTQSTPYQHFAITQGKNNVTGEIRHSLFINGHTQFSDSDEGLYHSLLTMPVLSTSEKNGDYLIIGGGDGLAARDILKSNPNSVLLIDLDENLINFFKKPIYDKNGVFVNEDFINLNNNSFNDKRVSFMFGDAFLNLKKLIKEERKFSGIIVDLPDPGHPDLNKLYSTMFYKMLNIVLKDSGSISIQSGSPYSAKDAFISIKKTLEASGFYVNQYQHNIPSFNAQWGWTIGTKQLPDAFTRLKNIDDLAFDDEWLTKGKLLSTFEFGKNFYQNEFNIKVNTIDNNATYNYYKNGWKELTIGVFE